MEGEALEGVGIVPELVNAGFGFQRVADLQNAVARARRRIAGERIHQPFANLMCQGTDVLRKYRDRSLVDAGGVAVGLSARCRAVRAVIATNAAATRSQVDV